MFFPCIKLYLIILVSTNCILYRDNFQILDVIVLVYGGRRSNLLIIKEKEVYLEKRTIIANWISHDILPLILGTLIIPMIQMH